MKALGLAFYRQYTAEPRRVASPELTDLSTSQWLCPVVPQVFIGEREILPEVLQKSFRRTKTLLCHQNTVIIKDEISPQTTSLEANGTNQTMFIKVPRQMITLNYVRLRLSIISAMKVSLVNRSNVSQHYYSVLKSYLSEQPGTEN